VVQPTSSIPRVRVGIGTRIDRKNGQFYPVWADHLYFPSAICRERKIVPDQFSHNLLNSRHLEKRVHEVIGGTRNIAVPDIQFWHRTPKIGREQGARC
jgi:hypothetical protein